MRQPESPLRLVQACAARLRGGEGIRLGYIAKTRYGKSSSMRDFAVELVKLGALDRVVVVESKRIYPGDRYASIAALLARPPRHRFTVFQGSDIRQGVDVNDAAAYAFAQAERPLDSGRKPRVLFLADELTEGARGQFWNDPDAALARIIERGGGHGMSAGFGTLMPQNVPPLALAQCRPLFLGALEAYETVALVRKGAISKSVADAVHEMYRLGALPGGGFKPEYAAIFIDAKSFDLDGRYYRWPLRR